MSLAVNTSVSTSTFGAAASRRLVSADPVSGGRVILFAPLSIRVSPLQQRRRRETTICLVLEKERTDEFAIGGSISVNRDEQLCTTAVEPKIEELEMGKKIDERIARKKSERKTYLIAAVMSTFGITSMAAAAVYYRFAWQMEGGEVPVTEMFGTFALSVGAAVGMEFWARWAHKKLWHASLWDMHESHHRPRDGPFELNDIFAIVNAVPAISLMSYGFLNRGLVPGLCFGAGLGITLFGIAYMFVHDGLVHRRFPVGPIEKVPYFRRVAAAHQIHHMDKFGGVPYGLFLGPKELEEVGGLDELEKVISGRIKRKEAKNSSD